MAAAYSTPTTELEAVNEMLRAIGESPVASISGTSPLPGDADVALRTLRWVTREVCAHAWHWNTEYKYPLPISPAGEIVVPSGTLAADTDDSHISKDVVLRGGRLYDRENHTFTFTECVTARIVFLLPYEEIPEAARNFVAIRAGRKFQQGAIGSEVLYGFTQRDEDAARALMMHAEASSADHNILTGSLDTLGIVDRRI